MNLISLGIVFCIIGIMVYWFSPASPHNVGYVSLQLHRNKNVWYWSNRFFGRLCLAGSLVLLITAVLQKLALEENSAAGRWALAIFLTYLILCIVITEIYIYIKIRKSSLIQK